MARIKGGMNAKRKHNKVLKLAKGYRGARSKHSNASRCRLESCNNAIISFSL